MQRFKNLACAALVVVFVLLLTLAACEEPDEIGLPENITQAASSAGQPQEIVTPSQPVPTPPAPLTPPAQSPPPEQQPAPQPSPVVEPVVQDQPAEQSQGEPGASNCGWRVARRLGGHFA